MQQLHFILVQKVRHLVTEKELFFFPSEKIPQPIPCKIETARFLPPLLLSSSLELALHLLFRVKGKVGDLELQEMTQTTKVVSRMLTYRLQFAGTPSCLAQSAYGVHNFCCCEPQSFFLRFNHEPSILLE